MIHGGAVPKMSLAATREDEGRSGTGGFWSVVGKLRHLASVATAVNHVDISVGDDADFQTR